MRLQPLFLLLPLGLAFASTPTRWKADLLKARREKDAEFKAGKASPLAGIQRLTVEAGQPMGLSPKTGGLEPVPDGTGAIAVRFKDGVWRWCEGGAEKPMAGGAVFSLGRFHVQGQLSPERATLLVFDPERPEVKAFRGLRYFPTDRAFVVEAEVAPVGNAEPITLTTTRQLKKTFQPCARLHFTLQGRKLALTAYQGGEDTLFVPFTDATTGQETYTVGRFMDVPASAGRKGSPSRTVILDFNTAYNPLCNYSSIWNCPLPPEENHLPVAIRAGEKAYGTH